MKKSKILSIYLLAHIALSILSFSLFIAGTGLLTLSYEKTAYAQANLFATNNSSTNSTLIFEYEASKEITDSKTINNYNNFLNDFSGSRKYFPLACGWTQSKETKVMFDDFTTNITFSDISYLENDNIEYASNLLQLSYPKTYAEAFEESSDKIYLTGDELKIEPESTYILSVRKGTDVFPNNLLNWSSSNTSVATVDEEGRITAKLEGETIITANLDELSDEIKIIVSSEFTKNEIISFTPCVVPLYIANDLTNNNPNDSIGKTFNAVFNNETVIFKIGGYYEDIATTTPYRNELYSNNIGQQIYILRNSNYYHYPIKKVYFTLTSQYKINMNMYNDIHYLKTISNLKFSIPSEMPINNIGFSISDTTTIYKFVDFVHKSEIKIAGWLLGCLSIVLFLFDFIFLRKKIPGSIFYLSSYICGVILTTSIFYLINPIKISNRICFLMNPYTGWTVILLGIIYSAIITRNLIQNNVKKNKKYLLYEIKI